jgi:hypothetical protein
MPLLLTSLTRQPTGIAWSRSNAAFRLTANLSWLRRSMQCGYLWTGIGENALNTIQNSRLCNKRLL